MAIYTFSSGGLVVEVEVVEDGFGNLIFTVNVADGLIIGDLRGLFVNMTQDVGDGTGWTISGDGTITDQQIAEGQVVDLGNGANMNGVKDGPYDIGAEIGTQGIGQNGDDIQYSTFTLSWDGGDLHVGDIEDIGVRLTSVGEVDGDREGSVKLIGEEETPPMGAQPITLVVEEEDAHLGLGGNEDETSSPDEDDDVDPNFDITTDIASGILTFTAGSTSLNSFVFSDVSGLTTETDGNAGQDLFWDRVTDILIVGYLDAGMTEAAVQIDLIAPASIDALMAGNVTVKVTLLDNLLHIDLDTNVEEVLDLGDIKVLASDGVNTVEGVVTIHEIDDVPIADIADGGGSVTIDETVGDQDDDDPTVSGTFAGVAFTGTDGGLPQYATNGTPVVDVSGSGAGADEEGATTVISLSIVGGDNVDSGLTTTGSALPIRLVIENGLIIGRVDSDNDGVVNDANPLDVAAFAIAIDQDGEASIALYMSLDHPDDADPDDSLDLTGLVNAVVTVTDGDGDEDTDSFGIGDKLIFDDDGPTADIADGGGSVTIDETVGDQDDDDPTVSGTFAGVAFTGTDGGLPQYATNGTPVVDVSGSGAGADEEGATTVISLSIVGGDNVDSGLTTTGSALPIRLVIENGLIIGRVDSDNDGVVNDANPLDVAAFAIAIDQDGEASIALYMSLDHPDDADPDDSLDLTGLVNAVVTVTDGDGDEDTDSFGIGDKLIFEDDGPTLSGVDDSFNSLEFAVGIMGSDAYDFNTGADDEGAPGVQLIDFIDPDDPADAAAFASSGLAALEAIIGDIDAVQVGNTVTYSTAEGDLFELTVDDSGWSFTILQEAPLIFNAIDFSEFTAGGPVETISALSDSGTTALFDGWLFGGDDGRFITDPQNPGAGSTADDLNPDNLGFGVRGGQASNINNNEGFGITFSDGGGAKVVQGLQFSMDQQGNTDDVAVAFELTNSISGINPTFSSFDNGTSQTVDIQQVGDPLDGKFYLYTTLPSGNNDIVFTILPSSLEGTYVPQSNEIVLFIDGEFDDSLFKMTYPRDLDPIDFAAPFENDSVRVKDVSLIEVSDVPDVTLAFDVQGYDGDGDATQVESFDVFISEDGGLIV